jgi:peptide chain release factor 2
MSAPGFWDDAEAAARVSAEHAAAARKLESYRSLESDIDDLETLEEMAAEDESIAAELEDQRASIETRLAELEEARLFSGEYDGGDAVVTVNAGAGGTDSQDWAEMLLRMEMRWAERRGMKVELKEASAASMSTRPTRPCASPTSRPASSSSARTSARSRPTGRPR